MANEWNTSYPLDHTLISGVPGEIRALKASVKTQLDRSHETPVNGDATGSEHSSGSGVAYEGTSTPTNRPDGATALADNAIDRGRLWLDDNYSPPVANRWDGSAFESLGMGAAGWAKVAANGDINASFNVSGVVRNGAGDYTISWDKDFGSSHYAVAVSCWTASGQVVAICVVGQVAGTVQVNTYNHFENATKADAPFFIIAFGAQ